MNARAWLQALAITACLALAAASPSHADDTAWTSRLDPRLATEVVALINTARAEGLPSEPLRATALQGAARHAPSERILQAVRAQLDAMRAARASLGPASPAEEIGAAASALMSGLSPDSLAALRAARPRESLVVPLVVMADFVARRVPPAVAAGAIANACRAGAHDDDLLRFREFVERDLISGAAVESAPVYRANALVLRLRGAPPPRR